NWPVISSVASRPLVTYQIECWSASGVVISMRDLSKYCTVRVPSGLSAYGSGIGAVVGAGPHIHVRLTCPAATGLSVRSHVRSKWLLVDTQFASATRDGANNPSDTKIARNTCRYLDTGLPPPRFHPHTPIGCRIVSR